MLLHNSASHGFLCHHNDNTLYISDYTCVCGFDFKKEILWVFIYVHILEIELNCLRLSFIHIFTYLSD